MSISAATLRQGSNGCGGMTGIVSPMARVAGWVLAAALMAGGIAGRAGEAAGPLAAEETVRSFALPEGFSASVFAAEPDVRQPISFCIDHRGRLWVIESFSYPEYKSGDDRVLILEDVDGDGRHDRRTIFYDGLTCATGIEVGFGGAWVMAPPNLLFIPDRDGDDGPDGEPVVLLDGFGRQGVHNIANGCTWGPDGWLYGGHGGTSSGHIGKPGTPKEERIFFDGGVWRYHPTRQIFEPFMEGTTNPWGVDFDDYGQAFVSNSVTPHLYHVIQGGHVERRRESPNSRHAYEVIDTIADHRHWVGGDWTESRDGKPEQIAVGGGHAHSGCMVYLGDSFPERYRGAIFMSNIHGDRINMDLPRRRGSGYTAGHGPDLLVCSDNWFMGLLLRYGPDGSVFLSDWYDTGECHTRSPATANGRIYRISYEGARPVRPVRVDVSRLSDEALVQLHLERNDWYVRQARRILQERGAGAGAAAREALLAMLREHPEVTRKLRALWTLHAAFGIPEPLGMELLESPHEQIRAWMIQFLAEGRRPSGAVLERFRTLAESDPSAVVRLYLASAAQRIGPEERWPIVERLAMRGEDAGDQNLPLMIWYATEPLVMGDPKRALALAARSRIPKLRELVTRRLAAGGE